MNPYSEDLRKKMVEAVDRGMPKIEAARTFGVGISSVKRYVAAARQGRSLVPKKRPGSKRKLDESARKLLEAIGWALETVTAKDAHGFFEHRGYRAAAQLLLQML